LWDEVNQVYRKPFLKPQPNMLNWLIYASGIDWIPQDMLRNLAARPDLLDRLSGDGGAGVNRLTRTLHAATDLLDRVPRALDAIRNQDLDRIKHSFTQPQ
jgi:hypothetical protein